MSSRFMNFSMKATIRAFVVRKHRLSCSGKRWRQLVRELERRGERSHEAGAFLLGIRRGERCEVRDSVFYDDLDSRAYASGVCVLHGDAFAKLWALCRSRGLTVVADVHTHPGAAVQSFSDRSNPMIARSGHIAIIIPEFGRWPIPSGQLGVYEYCGQHIWKKIIVNKESKYFYTGRWS